MVKDKDKTADGDGKEGRRHSRLFGSRRPKLMEALFPMSAPADVPDGGSPAEQPGAGAEPAQPATPPATTPAENAASTTVGEQPAAARATRRRAPAKSATAHVNEQPADAAAASGAAFTADSQKATDAADEAPAESSTASTRGTRTRNSSAKAPRKTKAVVETASSEPTATTPTVAFAPSTTALLFQAPDLPPMPVRRNGRTSDHDHDHDREDGGSEESSTVRRRARRRPGEDDQPNGQDAPRNTVVKVRTPRHQPELSNEPQKVRGSTRLEAKKQRRRDGRDAGRRRPVITEAEFLARRESVDRVMVVRSKFDRIQIAVLEDQVLVEHYVAQVQDASLIGNVYLGRVQNVLPSMEAAFVDIGRGRNAVLYSGEVDWDAAAENSTGGSQARRIELALKPGDKVLVQVTKDPVGHKGARLTSQVSLPGRYLVYVPNGSMNGISRKLPDTERARLKKILKEVLPENAGVIVRTAAEGATEEQLTRDVNRLTAQWAEINHALETVPAPALLHSEPDLLVKIVRDVFNEDFHKLVIDGPDAEETISAYLRQVAPDLIDRIETYTGTTDSFDEYRVSEQIEKALDRKVWLPSGGSLVMDRTEAMTVIDVNTGKFVGSGGNLEETVTKNNLEAAEEIVRQLRLRDIGGIIVVDFIDMVLESNRDLVLRRLVECLSRDRTKHQVAEVTSLGLVQMTRKKLGLGLIESFSEPCETCAGRGVIVHHDPVTRHRQTAQPEIRRGRGKGGSDSGRSTSGGNTVKNGGGRGTHAITDDVKNALAQIAASTIAAMPETDTDDLAKADSEQADAVTPVKTGQRPERARTPRQKRENHKPVEQAPEEQAPEQAPAEQAPADDTRAEPASDAAAEPAVAILDIPVKKGSRPARKLSTKDAESILDSVLDALPEPRQPGQGRARTSRRASSAGGAAPQTKPQSTPPAEESDQSGSN